MSTYEPDLDDLYDDVEETQRHENLKEAMILLIDCCPTMFEVPAGEETSPMSAALEVAAASMRSRIIQSPTDFIGVVFYGTKESKNAGNHPNVYDFVELDMPDAKNIIALEELGKAVRTAGQAGFERLVSPLDTSDMGVVFDDMNAVFSAKAGNFSSKRIMLITDRDTPDAVNLERARQRAKDVIARGVYIEPILYARPGKQFSLSKFYDQVLDIQRDIEEDVNQDLGGISKLNDMKRIMRMKQLKKRPAFRVPFVFGEDFEIAVAGFNVISEQKKPTGEMMLAGSTSVAELRTGTRYYDASTSERLERNSIRCGYTFGEKQAILTKEEYEKIRNAGPPGIYLLGFKPTSRVKCYNIGHSTFIYPDEKSLHGSSSVFVTLVQRMFALDKVGIAKFIPRQNSPPQLVALMPQLEDGLGKPTGLHLIRLPFADDMRSYGGQGAPVEQTKDLVQAAKNMIEQATVKYYRPSQYPNPALQKHYAILEALALNLEVPDQVQDWTRTAQFIQGASREIADFKHLLDSTSHRESETDYGRKRSRESHEEGDSLEPPTAKRVRSKSPVSINADAIKQMHQDGQLNKLTVAKLKEFLTSVGEKFKSTSKKDELIELVRDHFI